MPQKIEGVEAKEKGRILSCKSRTYMVVQTEMEGLYDIFDITPRITETKDDDKLKEILQSGPLLGDSQVGLGVSEERVTEVITAHAW